MNKKFRDNKVDGDPVFVVGMNGSGTTMLLDSLGNHPDLYAFPYETRVFPYFIGKLSAYGNLSEISARRKLAHDLGKSFPFWRANNRNPVVLDDKDLSEPGFSGVVNSLMTYFASPCNKQRWGEKSPMYIQHINLLAAHFPSARFIHVYRDGRDVVQSLHRRWFADPAWSIFRWKNIVRTGRIQGHQLGASRYLEVRYEALTTDPETEFRRIAEFLDLTYTSALCRSSMRQMDPSIKTGAVVANSEKWRTYFSQDQLTALESIAGAFLFELGYGGVTIRGESDPPAWKRSWWRFSNYFALTLSQFARRGLRSAPTFARKAMASVMQRQTNDY